MAIECCDIASNLILNIEGCVISVNTSSRMEFMRLCENEILTGPVIGTISLTAYASDSVYVGCPANAGVSIPWISKYDCELDIVHFLFGGEGSSYTVGDVSSYALKNNSVGRSYLSINANASSGPSTLIQRACREEGYGLRYLGAPEELRFDTSDASTLQFSAFSPDFNAVGDMLYLQSFSLSLNPGSFPTASYSFVFEVGAGTC